MIANRASEMERIEICVPEGKEIRSALRIGESTGNWCECGGGDEKFSLSLSSIFSEKRIEIGRNN